MNSEQKRLRRLVLPGAALFVLTGTVLWCMLLSLTKGHPGGSMWLMVWFFSFVAFANPGAGSVDLEAFAQLPAEEQERQIVVTARCILYTAVMQSLSEEHSQEGVLTHAHLVAGMQPADRAAEFGAFRSLVDTQYAWLVSKSLIREHLDVNVLNSELAKPDDVDMQVVIQVLEGHLGQMTAQRQLSMMHMAEFDEENKAKYPDLVGRLPTPEECAS